MEDEMSNYIETICRKFGVSAEDIEETKYGALALNIHLSRNGIRITGRPVSVFIVADETSCALDASHDPDERMGLGPDDILQARAMGETFAEALDAACDQIVATLLGMTSHAEALIRVMQGRGDE
jgi:hypothetical protein